MFRMKVTGAAHAEPAGRALLERLARNAYPGAMDTKQKEEAARRRRALEFRERHGEAAALEAFGVSRRTLFRWKAGAEPASRAHRDGYVRRKIHPALEGEIRRLREAHPRLGKEKLQPLLEPFCRARGIPVPAEATVGRMLAQLREAGRLPDPRKLRMSGKTGRLLEKAAPARAPKLRRGGYLPELPGDLLQVDGVLVYTLGQRRYTFTAVDLVSRWAYSRTYKTASSRNGADFLGRLLAEAPFEVRRLQTDNGSEFAKEFRDAAEAASLVHFHNWARSPKYQGWVERFNRTVQEEFLDWHGAALALDPDQFNPQLEAWLDFYNRDRVHRALRAGGRRLSPLQYLASAGECQTG